MAYKSYLGRTDLPRGLRNNNPGNLVQTSIPWQGKIPLSQNTDSRFEQFYELRYGIRAKMRDIISDYKKGLTSVSDLINEYAPSFENNTAAYINTVANMIGFAPTMFIPELTEDLLVKIAKALHFVENGAAYKDYLTDQDYQDALNILGIDLPKGDLKKKQ
jgi:hypothetical protein